MRLELRFEKPATLSGALTVILDWLAIVEPTVAPADALSAISQSMK